MMATGRGRASARELARKRKVERGGRSKDQAMEGAMDGEFDSLVTDLHEGRSQDCLQRKARSYR